MPTVIPSDDKTIAIVGGGLSGALCAIMLQRRGYTVHLFESRLDWREDSRRALDAGEDQSRSATKRSINLALSHRGRTALAEVGLEEQVMASAIPMRGRAVHSNAASGGNHDAYIPYDATDSSNAIYSVSRELLNNLLLDSAENLNGVTVHFGFKLTHIDRGGILHFADARCTPNSNPATYNDYDVGDVQIKPRLTIGADGAYSATREAMLRLLPLNFKREYITHGYKELTIPPNPTTGDFALTESEALHTWPRGDFMMIGLPNPDKSFTCTLFAPFTTGKDPLTGTEVPGMNDQKSPDEIKAYFEEHFPDAIPLMPDYIAEYQRNPACQLVTVQARPWNYKDSIILLGDAAHAMVPFYGQGMNAGFEDVQVLCHIIDKHNQNLKTAIPEFAESREADGEAIAALSMANYRTMRKSSGSALFRIRKRIEGVLNWMLPATWIPQYKMVAFTSIPYSEAIRRSKSQDIAVERFTTVAVTSAVAFAAFKVAKAVSRAS